MKSLKELRKDQPIVLRNVTCTYCGVNVLNNGTREHVIGRKFVPQFKWGNDWNLIVKACESCNNHKSKLENDISAITLLASSEKKNDFKIASLAIRKATGSKSDRTRKQVINSHEKTEIKIHHPSGLNFNFKLTAPPQIDDTRAFELARLQMSAFFYLITFDKNLNQGYFWPGEFSPIITNRKEDWGNPIQLSFMKAVRPWEYRWMGITADGYFKSIIRKHPTEKCWAWALEWNMSYRVIGFFGEKNISKIIYDKFEQPKLERISNESESIKITMETTLLEEEDILFEID